MTADSILAANKKTAVVLFQLGGPDSLNAVEPFLYNLFMDPDIIDFPLAFLARRQLAKFISKKRSLKVQENYKQIGGKSPILELTQCQAKALELNLRNRNIDAAVFIAMRYWHPLTGEVVGQIRTGGFEQVILLPLYPQYSQATTYSSINEWKRETKKQAVQIPTQLICCYPGHPALIEAFVENINLTVQKFRNLEPKDIDLIFSAHGVPLSFIQKGDPYQLQVEETVHRVMEQGRWDSPHTLCYQSKVGPMKWLKPSLLETVDRLAQSNRKNLLIIPIAFVTDHIETLHEINIEVRKHAVALGIEKFEIIPALSDHRKFIECLSDLTMQQFKELSIRTTCKELWKQDIKRSKPKKCFALHSKW